MLLNEIENENAMTVAQAKEGSRIEGTLDFGSDDLGGSF